jgi:hypothetical protein
MFADEMFIDVKLLQLRKNLVAMISEPTAPNVLEERLSEPRKENSVSMNFQYDYSSKNTNPHDHLRFTSTWEMNSNPEGWSPPDISSTSKSLSRRSKASVTSRVISSVHPTNDSFK